ncbi:MAG: thioesterase domain-containing protein [Balneolaceae bacterium]
MTKKEAQHYIYTNIPITKAMGFKIVELSRTEVRLSAPLKKNINHRGSAFGGSIDSLFLTTGWAFIRFLINHYTPTPIIVGNKGSTTFLKPILKNFEAHLTIPSKEEVDSFLSTFERFGKARITLAAVIEDEEKEFAVFKGDYVVVKSKE